ncbi:MAG: ATP-binding cassette domain-containing protein [Nanoarchaeota archaeon]
MKSNIINIQKLSKNYGKFKAIDNLSLSVQNGSIFGILGPNGAGKTTLLSILTTLLHPTKGTIKICGFDLLRQPNEIRKRIGVVFQESVIDDELTAYDNLDLHARLYKIKKLERDKRINDLLSLVSLTKRKHDLIKKFSGGMKRKVEVIRGLLNYPSILFLDEPTLGLDPKVRRKIWEYVLKINQKHKTTVVIATNYMEEAQFLCTDIAIINNGKINVVGRKNDLLKKIKKDTVKIDLFLDIDRTYAILKKLYPTTKTSTGISIKLKNSEQQVQEIVTTLNKNNISVESIQIIKPNLDDVFLKYTGEKLE